MFYWLNMLLCILLDTGDIHYKVEEDTTYVAPLCTLNPKIHDSYARRRSGSS